MAVFVAVQNVAAAFNQFVNPIALKAIAWKYYGVYLVIEVGYLIFMYFFFPETRRKTIEEVSVIFDNYGKSHENTLGQEAQAHVEVEAAAGKISSFEQLEDTRDVAKSPMVTKSSV